MKPNQLWVNQRDGRFADEALARGLALNGAGKAEAGMADRDDVRCFVDFIDADEGRL